MSDTNKGPEPDRYNGLCVIDDGYTLRAEVGATNDPSRPKVTIVYRPALPERVYEYRRQLAEAVSGIDRLNCIVSVLNEHIQSWSGVIRMTPTGKQAVKFDPGDSRVPGTLGDPAVRRALGVEYLDGMLNYVCGYLTGRWEEDAKNS